MADGSVECSGEEGGIDNDWEVSSMVTAWRPREESMQVCVLGGQ